MQFNIVSPGELQAGQWVTILGLRPQQKMIVTGAGQVLEVTEEDKNPWIKGLPFRVQHVQLPIVMLGNVLRIPTIPAAIFHDTRLVEFLEVDEEYAFAYMATMYPPVAVGQAAPDPAPPEEKKKEPTEEQLVFGFHETGDDDEDDEDDDGMEEGEPPLVPVGM